MDAGKLIQNARRKAGLTQKELGKKLGVSASMIGQYENNLRNPKMETLSRIAIALNTSVEYLQGCAPMDAEDPQSVQEFKDDFLERMNKTINTVLKSTPGSLSIYTPPVDPRMERLSNALEKLNEDGWETAINRIEELSEIPRYQFHPEKESPEE